MQLGEFLHNRWTVGAVCYAEPFRIGVEHAYGGFASVYEGINAQWDEELGLRRVYVLVEELAEFALGVVEEVGSEAPEVHRHGRCGFECLFLTVFVGEYDAVFRVVADGCALDNGCQQAVFGFAYATCHRAVFGHGVADAETYHRVVAFLVARAHEVFCDDLERVAAIEVVGVDYGEWFFDDVFTHQYGVVRAPGFGAVGRYGVSFGEFVDGLENDFSGHDTFVFAEHFFAEVGFEIFADYKYDFAEPGADAKGLERVVNSLRVICPELPFPIVFHEVTAPEEVIEMNGYKITAFRVQHNITCYGYSLEISRKGKFDVERAKAQEIPIKCWNPLQKGETVTLDGKTYTPDMVLGPARKGLKVTYCTDTRPIPSISEHAKGSDLFICEGMYGEPEKQAKAKEFKHMTFYEAAKLAKDAEVAEMWLTHFSPSLVGPQRYMDEVQKIFPAAELGKDGRSVELLFEEETKNE